MPVTPVATVDVARRYPARRRSQDLKHLVQINNGQEIYVIAASQRLTVRADGLGRRVREVVHIRCSCSTRRERWFEWMRA